MSGWSSRRAREYLREIDDCRHDQKVGGWLLVGALLWMAVMVACWVAVVWAGIVSIGRWDAGTLVIGGGFALLAGSGAGGVVTVSAAEEYMKDRYKTVKAEREYEDYCLEVADA